VWPSIVVVLLFGLGVGLVNGVTVVRTRLPSFIVTLGTFFILQGVNAGGTLKLTGSVAIQGIDSVAGFESARHLFATTVWSPYDFKVKIIWWIAITALGIWLLARTRFGNWIFAVGGDPVAARNVGVPVARTKIALFMLTSLTASVLGIITAIELRSIQANEGVGREFIFIIAAVVGGCLLTGGYGSVIGTAFGAAILGMAGIGIILSNWDSNWVYAFQGVILVLAVMLNAAIRTRAARVRSR
jgi:simple sugar transport system permease protein